MSGGSDAGPVVGELDVGTLHAMLNEAGNVLEDVQLVDVREEEEQSIASLPGFQLMPLSRYHRPTLAEFPQLSALGVLHLLQASRVLGQAVGEYQLSHVFRSGSSNPCLMHTSQKLWSWQEHWPVESPCRSRQMSPSGLLLRCRFQEWGPVVTEMLDPSKTTLVLCHHGVRSFRAASFLAQQVCMLLISCCVSAYTQLQ